MTRSCASAPREAAPAAVLAAEAGALQAADTGIMATRDTDSSSPPGSAGDSQQDVEMQAAINFINSRRYQDALNVLNRMQNRTSMWYYASAFANAGLGNNVLARDQAATAVNMEPNNVQYRQLLNQIEFNSRRYQNNPYGGGYYGSGSSCGTGNMCCDLCIADQLCECMGGDLCTCM